MKKFDKIHFNLIIVANESMSYDVVLGRDFMEACNLNLNLDSLTLRRVPVSIEIILLCIFLSQMDS